MSEYNGSSHLDHFFFKIMNGVLNIESYHFANWHLAQWTHIHVTQLIEDYKRLNRGKLTYGSPLISVTVKVQQFSPTSKLSHSNILMSYNITYIDSI